ncbi:aspartate aminotransferase family protein [Roseococcus sp. DSY-14]|uniref:aminotransferase family protein n=1 Tax=Roseococcus sp. DSY-14 TaxID=3369650 RepID=UPI00387B326C
MLDDPSSAAADSSLKAKALQYVWHPFQRPSEYRDRQYVFCSGRGPYVTDSSGREYLDAISGLWNVNFGYSEKRISDAVSAQLMRMPFASLIVASHEPAIQLAEAIASRTPAGLEVSFFTSGGSEAVESAIKIARHAALRRGQAARRNIVALRRSYHGMSYGALSATGIAEDRWQYGAMLSDTIHAPGYQEFSDRADPTTDALAALHKTIEFLGSHTCAAIIAEPILGAGGMHPSPPGYLRGVRDLCDRIGALLIFDEVVSGWGRCGKMFAADLYGVAPDMLVLAKGMSGGYAPLGAVVVHRAIYELFDGHDDNTFMHGFTYGGSPAGCAAALASLSILESDDLLIKIEADGKWLHDAMEAELAPLPYVGAIRGAGLMLGVDLVLPDGTGRPATPEFGAAVRREARDAGVIIRPTYGGATFNFAPPFICSRGELERIVSTTKAAILKAASESTFVHA